MILRTRFCNKLFYISFILIILVGAEYLQLDERQNDRGNDEGMAENNGVDNEGMADNNDGDVNRFDDCFNNEVSLCHHTYTYIATKLVCIFTC